MRTSRLAAVSLFLALLTSVGDAADTRTVADGTGRNIKIPEKITRVYAAGPPASMFVFALAPDKLVGWTRAMRPHEEIFLPKQFWGLPELGRLTGRGNTANVEVILAAKADLIIDAGSVAPTFVSLAERVQEQTGIPYLLYDGSFARTAETFRNLGVVLGEEARGKQLAEYIEKALADIGKNRCGSRRQASARLLCAHAQRPADGLAGFHQCRSARFAGGSQRRRQGSRRAH